MKSFNQLNLKDALTQNLETLGYKEMTPIQSQALPKILKGCDLIAQAKTGSGKTAAFGLGVLEHLNVKKYRAQSLVLCPTRELADQVAKELRKLARAIHNIKVLTLCGGSPFGPQVGSLEHGAHIIVGTPGRIEEHLRKRNLNLDHLQLLVLDEADRMLDMGFKDALDEIISYTPKKRQTLLFSATYPKEIEAISNRIMKDPVTIKIAAEHEPTTIEQHFIQVEDNAGRFDLLANVLREKQPESSVVFCNTKKETEDVAEFLKNEGCTALALHGDLEQKMRDQILVRFANKSASVLVATDVAARGLDIANLDAVFNFHIARDSEVHVHRIGRTGRAGNKGYAVTFVGKKEEYKIERLEERFGYEITVEPANDHVNSNDLPHPRMATLQINGGKKQKVRPGDILGALTGENGVQGSEVGKIHIFDQCAYVAVAVKSANFALKKLEKGKLKGRTFRVRRIRG